MSHGIPLLRAGSLQPRGQPGHEKQAQQDPPSAGGGSATLPESYAADQSWKSVDGRMVQNGDYRGADLRPDRPAYTRQLGYPTAAARTDAKRQARSASDVRQWATVIGTTESASRVKRTSRPKDVFRRCVLRDRLKLNTTI